MKMASVKVLFCVLLIFYIQNGETIDINTLKLANVMYRHGDRGPYRIFKTDIHQVDTWDQGLGYLTQLGMQQQYHLGQYLRNRYQRYLNQTYIRSEFHITSSTIDRCLMSAYCNLAGIFPPTGRQIWNKELLWQPIPVHTVPDDLDNMLSINKPCPLYDKLYKDSYQSKSVLEEEAENKELYKFVSEKSGEANVTIDTSWIISDTLFCEKNHNIKWPSWVNETIYNKLRELESWGYDLLYRSPVQKRLKGGPLLKQMIKNMKMKIAGTLTEKMMVYSAHDSTIVAFLNNLDLYNMVIPPFTATVMMDLHQENDQYYILLYYKNDTWPEPVNIMTLTLPVMMNYLGSICIILYSVGAVICCKESDLQFWVSDVEGFPQQKNFLKHGCLSPTSDSSGPQITVDLTKHHQKMLGFGAAMTHSSAYLIFNSPHRHQIMESLFSSSKGTGINVIRMPIDGSDFVPNQPYTYADSGNINDFSISKDKQYMIPILKQALSLNPDLEIIASPWSAPAWMKWAPYWNRQSSSLNGGSFNMKFADIYATYLVKFIQAYQHEGIKIYAMTVQNEPGFEADGYPTMKLDAPDERDFVKVLGPKFASANIHTKIIIYDHNWDHPEYPISILNDHTAKRYISGSAFHCYGGDRKSPAQVANAHPDRDIYFTECTGSGGDTTWKRVFRWNFVNLFVGQPRVFAKTVLLWNLALDENHGPVLTTPGCSRGCGCKDCRGVVTVHSDKSGFDKNIEYYIIQHFTKFVHRNAIRLESTSDLGDGGTLHSVAFKNPNGDIILIVINDSWTNKQTFRVTIGKHTYKYTDIPTEGAVVFQISEAGSTIIG